ncbi:MAG: hypothetical protein L3J43_11830 [Sulfurovum sp.]|nr:hypothetical protein [Sulfurovum sp.]
MNKQNISFLSVTLLILTACCPTDHTSKIKKIAQPMSENLSQFFHEMGNHPDEQQRDALLEKSGCKISKNTSHTCTSKGNTFRYASNLELNTNTYVFMLDFEKSFCGIEMTSQGEVQPMSCGTQSCISK